MKFFLVRSLILGPLLLLTLSGCSDSGGSDFSGLDSSASAAKIPCKISDKLPTSSTMKVAAASGTKTVFNITPSTSSCKIYFFINGVKVNSISASYVEIDSTSFATGVNIVKVEASNDLGSDSFEWSATKNAAPTCTRTSPTASALNMINSASQLFTVGASGEAGETLSFTWILDGAAHSSLVETISGASASQANFTGNSSLNGVRTVSARVSDGYDTVTCSWTANVGDDCSISAKTPNVASVRLAATGASGNYSVTTSTTTCLVAWTLNGVDLTGNSNSRTMTSSDLNSGSNILKAEVSSSSGSTSQTWTLVKNSPPSCAQTPASTGAQTSVGSPLSLIANVTDANSDTVTWNWFMNGSTPSTPPVVITNGSNTTTAVFTPTSGNIGYNSFALSLSDGYDTTNCTWNVQVNPLCSISSNSPVSATPTVAAAGGTINTFNITPSDAACSISWTLNGINLGTNSTMVNLLSSSLGSTNNLTATVSNSSSSSSQTWTVKKNTVPVCASQTPTSTGFIFGVGASQAFVANITEPDSGQTLSYDWKHNGSTPSATYFSSSNTATSATGTWTATSGQIGAHNLVVNVTDSYDSVSCSWPVEVMRNCSASSSTPSGSTLRVANLASTTTSFGVVANDPSCVITWKLNGTTVSSGQNFQDFLSSALSSSNTIDAVLTNSVSTTTRSWTVTKNSPPVCASQTPSAGGNTVNIGSSQAFNMTSSDANSDTLSYTWGFNGAATASFSAVTGVGYTASATFTPSLGQVGTGQVITSTMSDTYDTAACTWTLDVLDPNSAQILSWTPTSTPVVILSTGSQTFTVSATGTGLTYAWALDGVTQAGMTTASATFTYSDMTVGNHTVLVTVTDTYNNQATKSFAVRRNAAPTVSAYSPNVSGVTSYKVGYQQNLAFSVTATDLNSDTLTYQWQLDNASSATIPGTASSATFNPGGSTLLLGPHTIKAIISDGHESATITWNIMVNYFSDECNELYNSSPTGSNGGRVCTLVGNPSMGHSLDILTDPTLLKARPYNMVELQTGIYAMSDHVNHGVIIFNSNSSGNFVGFGRTVLPKTAQLVIGNGAPGRNSDASVQTAVFQSVGSPAVSMPSFKLNQPHGLAYDSGNGILYIADRSNHRVIALNANGEAYRILGESGGTASNVAVSNTDGALGNTHSCNQPIGLTIVGNYLYVTCQQQHAIKRVQIDTPSNAGTYGLTTIIVGRQNATGATFLSGNGVALPDGLGGSSNNVATGATALAAYPTELSSDGNGIIYWNERQSGNHGLRIRAYNTTVSDVDLTPSINSNLTSATSLLFRSIDLTLSGAIGTYTSAASQAVNASAGTLSNFLVSSHARMVTNSCHAVSVTMRDVSNIPISNASIVTVTMTANAAANYYSDAGCTTPLTGGSSNQFSLAIGSVHQTIFVKPTAAATYTWTATSAAITGTTSSTVSAASVVGATRLRVFASPRFKYDECVPVEVQITDASNVPNASGAIRYVAIDTNSIGQFYSNSNCTGRISRVGFASTDTTKVAYYKRQIYVPAGWVASVAGYDDVAPSAYTDYANGVKIGDLKVYSPTGLAILKNGSTGFPDAIVWGTDQSSINYLNMNTSSATYGGRTFTSLRSDVILGLPNNLVSPTSISANFNGDDQASWGTATNNVQGVSINLAKSSILFGDYNNRRGRATELNSGNLSRTLAGAGRDRWRQNVTSINAQTVSLYNPYKIEHVSGSLYFSELNNHWIRRVSLATGIVDNVAGNGYAASYTEANDATTEGMRNPRGFKVVAYPDSVSPTNYVLFYAESASCIVRAVNISGPSISNFFGVGTLLPGKVKTVAGDYTLGCSTWGSSSNTDGMAAISARLNGPEDIAYIGGEIYILEYNDHCLLKVDTNGLITRPQGGSSCSTTAPTTNDSLMTSMRTRYPRAFYPDAGKPGNYFFVDQYADATGFLRYINALTSIVTFKNTAPVTVTARANPAAPLVVKTIYQQTASSGASNIGGVTSWSASTSTTSVDDKVCWSAGALSNGASGNHAVYCANRYLDDDGNLVAGPSNASGLRAGGSIDREQEKIGRLNATFYSPYGLAFDDEGNLYVTEYDNHIIRMIRRWW